MKLEQNIRCTCTGEKLDSLVEKSSDLKVQLRRCSTKTGKETNQCCTITVEHFEAKQSYFVEAGWITEMGKTKSMRQW
ncbi:hypothetical protein CUMW_278970 [Citrus unshiu]|uniref:Uncharacterized protein n=1 Tax=Citrus unshiu TaxID=55188 RepID=A0A2H5N6T4_CITUN|nr:hypothetical protein CUMW_278970 [Citrus unshiu]